MSGDDAALRGPAGRRAGGDPVGDRSAGRSGDRSADHFRRVAEYSPDLVAIFGPDGRFAYANVGYTRVLGYDPCELVGCSPVDFVHADDRARLVHEFSEQLAQEEPTTPVAFRFRAADGTYRHLEAVAVDLSAEPAVGGVLVTSRDVSDRRRAELAVQAQAAILERIARAAPLHETLAAVCALVEHDVPDSVAAVLLVHDEQLSVVAAPSASPEIVAAIDGAHAPRETGEALEDGLVVAPITVEPANPMVAPVLRRAGFTTWWGAPLYHPAGEGVIGALVLLVAAARDPERVERQLLAGAGSLAAIAVERDRVEAHLAHQASHDVLTGLPNREHFVQRLHDATQAQADGVSALFFLDLDRFKLFNDSAGHGLGDRILCEVASRLRASLRDGDTVARFGGDEFVVVCTGLTDADEVARVGRRLLDVIARPYELDGMEVVVTASIGVTLVDETSPEELLRDADTAMYRAKDRGRARVEIFDGELRDRVVRRLETERDLRRALDTDELTVHYQPVVSLATGTLAGFEALVRWEHPTRGLLLPDDFLAVAEEAGLLPTIGSLVRERALGQWAEWAATHPEWGEMMLGMNLAASELRDRRLAEQVADVLGRHGADARLMFFEASEEVLAADTDEARVVLGELDELGVVVALDDFGTGASPLLHLRRFPIGAIKLDGMLVAGLGVNHEDDVLVAGVIRLAHDLGLFVVAEGIERDEQADHLRDAGCLLGQGHVVAPAMPSADAATWAVTHLRARVEPTAD